MIAPNCTKIESEPKSDPSDGCVSILPYGPEYKLPQKSGVELRVARSGMPCSV